MTNSKMRTRAWRNARAAWFPAFKRAARPAVMRPSRDTESEAKPTTKGLLRTALLAAASMGGSIRRRR